MKRRTFRIGAAAGATLAAAVGVFFSTSRYRGDHASAAPVVDSGPPAWKPFPRSLAGADYWVLAGERASRTLPAHRPTVLFVGDSLTEWWLRYGIASWEADFAPLGAYDDGVAGDTTSNVLYRLESGSLTGIDPKLVVVEVGTNNIGLLGQQPAEVVSGIEAVVDTLTARLPGARVLLEDIYPRGNAHTPERLEVDSINTLLAHARFPAAVTLTDPGRALLGDDQAFKPGVMHNDLLHPTPAGYRILAAQLDPLILHLLGDVRT